MTVTELGVQRAFLDSWSFLLLLVMMTYDSLVLGVGVYPFIVIDKVLVFPSGQSLYCGN